MKAESIVFAIAGSLFGLIVGWILGSQQTLSSSRAAAPRGPANRRCTAAGGSSPATGRPARSRTASQAMRTAAEQNPKDAKPRVQLGNLYFDAERYTDAITWYEAALKHQSGRSERLHRSGRGLLLHEPAGSRGQAVRAFVVGRSQAHQDAAEPGHRQGVRQAGSRTAPRRRGSRSWRWRRTVRKDRPRRKALEGLHSAHPGNAPREPAGE